MYSENPEGTKVIIGSMNMGYISDTARNRTHNLFRPKWEPISLVMDWTVGAPSPTRALTLALAGKVDMQYVVATVKKHAWKVQYKKNKYKQK